MLEKLQTVLRSFFDEVSKLDKPQQERIGGTYYGGTQLFSHVGNMLEYIEDGHYTKYSYGNIRTNYEHVYAVKIGGAYKVSTTALVKELSAILGGYYNRDMGIGIIDDFGTNFSFVGFGIIRR